MTDTLKRYTGVVSRVLLASNFFNVGTKRSSNANDCDVAHINLYTTFDKHGVVGSIFGQSQGNNPNVPSQATGITYNGNQRIGFL